MARVIGTMTAVFLFSFLFFEKEIGIYHPYMEEHCFAYRVKEGDSLWVIGKRLGVPWQKIARESSLRGTIIKVGQGLRVKLKIRKEFWAKCSWYGPKFHGRKMANGEIFDMRNPYVVAHKTLPFGSKILFENPKTQKKLVAIVKDRGPFIPGREFDLSKRAAEMLGFKREGVAILKVKILESS
ncbi:MAG TPA: septal ring lytic transglycosylase RlpA family protein [Candidatus Parcubacteria bacterium]|nr:septal ring lytic transglycosylase RlpA family protein [Candidatus Parcubacteria bacterium]